MKEADTLLIMATLPGMKKFMSSVLISVALLTSASADEKPADAEARAKARAAYPTPNCVVSGEHLEGGKIVEYVYKQEGKPDRLVRLCCNKCVARFKGNPAKYLEKLDAAEAAKAARKN